MQVWELLRGSGCEAVEAQACGAARPCCPGGDTTGACSGRGEAPRAATGQQPTWDGLDAGRKVVRVEELMHQVVGVVLGALPDLQQKWGHVPAELSMEAACGGCGGGPGSTARSAGQPRTAENKRC